MAKIKDITASEIFDSRGKTTLEVKVTTNNGAMVSDSVPSGTSTGSFEAKVVDPKVAVNNINHIIKEKLIGLDPNNQQEIDEILLKLDGTKDKSKLGANAILGTSLAVSRAGAVTNKIPLYQHLNKLYNDILSESIKPVIPTPMMVMIEGGKHADNNLCIQEFLVICDLEKGKKIWQNLQNILKNRKVQFKLGLEGGFTPNLKFDEDAIGYIINAINNENLKIPTDVKLGLDIAAGYCKIGPTNALQTFQKWPIYSLEDPLSEDNWNDWTNLKKQLDKIKRDYLLVGDDLFVTNQKRLEKGIKDKCANAIIIKLNQVGSVWETLNVIALAHKAGFTHIVSHRSGETRDTFMADLAVATAAKYMKSGAPFATERVVKYNRLLEIQKEINL